MSCGLATVQRYIRMQSAAMVWLAAAWVLQVFMRGCELPRTPSIVCDDPRLHPMPLSHAAFITTFSHAPIPHAEPFRGCSPGRCADCRHVIIIVIPNIDTLILIRVLRFAFSC